MLPIVTIVRTDNFWKANMEQFYKMKDIKTKIIDRLSKQLNVMQTTHLQQPDHILSLNERHTTRRCYEKVKRRMRSIRYSLISTRSEEMIINNEKYIMTSK